MKKFNTLLELVEKYGATYKQGNSWDTIWITTENHIMDSVELFHKCKVKEINVYNLYHTTEGSYFNYK